MFIFANKVNNTIFRRDFYFLTFKIIILLASVKLILDTLSVRAEAFNHPGLKRVLLFDLILCYETHFFNVVTTNKKMHFLNLII